MTVKSKLKEMDEDEEDDKGEWKTVTAGTTSSAEKPKMFAKDAEIDVHIVVAKLNEVFFIILFF